MKYLDVALPAKMNILQRRIEKSRSYSYSRRSRRTCGESCQDLQIDKEELQGQIKETEQNIEEKERNIKETEQNIEENEEKIDRINEENIRT